MVGSTQSRYEKFLNRVKFTSQGSLGIPMWNFTDCINIGEAFRLSKRGHPCFNEHYICPSAVFSSGFTEEEIESLFKPLKVSNRRRATLRRNNLKYRKRSGAFSHRERLKKNVEEYIVIDRLQNKGLRRREIAKELNLSIERVRYLIQTFGKER